MKDINRTFQLHPLKFAGNLQNFHYKAVDFILIGIRTNKHFSLRHVPYRAGMDYIKFHS